MAHPPPASSKRTATASAASGGLSTKRSVLLLVIALTFVFVVLLATSSSTAPRSLLLSAPGHALLPDESRGSRRVGYCPNGDVDYMPCEDPKRSSTLSREMNFYRERHCPEKNEHCLVPLPVGYKVPVRWPESLDKIWHSNMPHNKIVDRKGHQGWMKIEGPFFVFPGGGTMFPGGAGEYIERLKQYIPLTDGTLRTALDMGCGVASFGGYLLAEGILTMSFAPRDSHKSQIQFALERGIPAFVAMLGTRRLPFPAFSFDFVHCSRCLIPFTAYHSAYLIEVDRLLRPGGYLVISGPPVQWAKQEKEWEDLQAVAKALCYEKIAVEGNTAVWKKTISASCLPSQNEMGLELCSESDNPSVSWYFNLTRCISRTSYFKGNYAIGMIPKWPERLNKAPARAILAHSGNNLEADTSKWGKRVAYYKQSLKSKLGTSAIRNVMDLNASFGGFAAALADEPVWVMNVVPAGKPSTLSAIFDRGLVGVYHDWCEPFSTYPRTYDFLHVDGIDSLLRDQDSMRTRCNLLDLMVEMDRILRPEGTVLVRDSPEVIDKVNSVAQAVGWTSIIHEPEPGSPGGVKILVATKTLQ